MAKNTDQAFESIRIVGGLLGSKVLQDARAYKLPGQNKTDYAIEPGLSFNEEMGRYWRIAQGRWKEYQQHIERQDISSHKLAQQEWLLPLLTRVFGYDVEPSQNKVIGEREFPITHFAHDSAVPLVLCGADFDLDKGDVLFGQEGRKRSPMGLAQEYLNAENNCLWAIISNGRYLRLLRDNPAMTRPAYLEVDFSLLLEEDNYADFATLWLLLQASRIQPINNQVEQCWLEQWCESGQHEGERALDKLRYGVAEALRQLGTGFVAHPDNQALRDKISSGELTTDAYFQQVLRLVYRFLFMLTAEDRDVLLLPEEYDGTDYRAARTLYQQGYSISQLRERARLNRYYDKHSDAWQQLLVTFAGFANGQPQLAQPALGGLFALDQCADLEASNLQNRFIFSALFNLAYFEHERVLSRINYRDMDTEEFGSVYESLLELIPQLSTQGQWQFSFVGDADDESAASGHSRKLTGSYYTPDSLVQELIKSALEPVIKDRLKLNPRLPRDAILSIKVCDPACGSGHFLLAAARRLAVELAGIDAGADQPTERHYRHAIREVVRHCIFGVDLNPLAVELCKTGLWMESIEPGKPLSFLDAHIQCGNALVGIFDDSVLNTGIPEYAYKNLTEDDKNTCSQLKKQLKLHDKQMQLFGSQSNKSFEQGAIELFESLDEDTLSDVKRKRNLWDSFQALESTINLKMLYDAYVAAFFARKIPSLYDLIPTTETINKIKNGESIDSSQASYISNLAIQNDFFHWKLSFPSVFMGESRGFDLVIGNPPWKRLQFDEQRFFDGVDVEIYKEKNQSKRKQLIEKYRNSNDGVWKKWLSSFRKIECSAHYMRSAGQLPLTANDKFNLYSVFTERALQASGRNGAVGLIVDAGLVSDKLCGALLEYVFNKKKVRSIIEFENSNKIFKSVHKQERFVLIAFKDGGEDVFCSFSNRNVSRNEIEETKVLMRYEDLCKYSPDVFSVPKFSSQYEYDIFRKCYQKSKGFYLEKESFNPWDIKVSRYINVSDFSGSIKYRKDLGDSEMEGYSPLMEGKLFSQYDHKYSTYDGEEVVSYTGKNRSEDQIFYRYIPIEIAQRKNGLLSTADSFLVARDITHSTNERGVIAAIIPARITDYTVRVVEGDLSSTQKCILLSSLNSLVVDFVARMRIGGNHLSNYIIYQLPIISIDSITKKDIEFIVPRVLELTYTDSILTKFAKGVGFDGEPFKYDVVRRHKLKSELDAYYARLYGLTRKELSYILDPKAVMGEDYPSETFRVLKNKEQKEFGEYRTQRLVLEAWDNLEAGTLEATPIHINTQVSGDTTSLPDNYWMRPGSDLQAETTLQLAAILLLCTSNISIKDARLALLTAMEPRVLTPFLKSDLQAEWLRLNGQEAVPMDSGTIRLQPNTQSQWGAAISQLRASGLLIENLDDRIWSPGQGLGDFPSPSWAEGRAEFVLAWLGSDGAAVDVVSELPQELRGWVDENVA